MVSGTGTTTGNADTLTTAEANKPPIYQELLNEMDAGTRAVVEAAGSANQRPGEASAPQHRSRVNARAGQGHVPPQGATVRPDGRSSQEP